MYSLVIPPELLGELCGIREKTGMSIRSQALGAVKSYLKKHRNIEGKSLLQIKQ